MSDLLDQERYPDAQTIAESFDLLPDLSSNTDLNMDPPTPAGPRRRHVRSSQSIESIGLQPQRPKPKTSDPPDEDGRLSSQDDRPAPGRPAANEGILERMPEEDHEILDGEETGLTASARTKWQSFLINCGFIFVSCLCSIALYFYNKWIVYPEEFHFEFPLFMTCTNLVVQFCLASIVLCFKPHFRPRYDSISNPRDALPADEDQEAHQNPSKKPPMKMISCFIVILTAGISTGLDIGLGNASLKFTTLTFYTMCKSPSLAFVLLFACFLGLERVTWRLLGIIAMMTAGVVLSALGEVKFSAAGFFLVMLAAVCSGLRWTLTQILLRRIPATSNPLSSIVHLAPVMLLVTLFIIAIPIEQFQPRFNAVHQVIFARGWFLGLLTLLAPGVITFLMKVFDLSLLKRTSVITLSIKGIVKEAVTIVALSFSIGDQLTTWNIVGLVVTIIAIGAYTFTHERTVATNPADLDYDSGSDADVESEAQDNDGHASAPAIVVQREEPFSPATQTGRSSLPRRETSGLTSGHSRQSSAVTSATMSGHTSLPDGLESTGGTLGGQGAHGTTSLTQDPSVANTGDGFSSDGTHPWLRTH